MKRNLLICLFCLLSLTISSMAEYPIPTASYQEDVWNVDNSSYRGFSEYPASGLSAFPEFLFNEPMDCYPNTSGHVKGVSDTISISVSILNSDTTDFVLGAYQIQTWFMPVAYSVMMDPTKFAPIVDTSRIRYAFVGWYNAFDISMSPPNVIPKNQIGRYSLLYYVWGLPVGSTRLLMTKTNNAPTNFQMLIPYLEPIRVSQPRVLGDTLNAYGACCWRAIKRGNYAASASWCDSMLVRNRFSAPAYLLKAYSYGGLNDSTRQVASLDSTIAILKRFGDPALGDTTSWTPHEWDWYNAKLQGATFWRWKIVTGRLWLKTL